MKKSLLALAVLGAFAASASAQSSVTIYGKIDVGGVLDSGAGPNRDAHSVRISSGVAGGSRLGFKGSEDLGGGLRANFVAETGFCADSNAGAPNFCTGGNNFMGRQAFVGLSGGFGETRLGRQYTPAFGVHATLDPFGAGYAGQAANVTEYGGNGPGNPRFNNAVTYMTPNLSGFSASVGVGFGETTGNWKANRAQGLSASYANGPLYVGLGYHEVNTATGSTGKKTTIVGAVYDLGVAKIHAMYTSAKDGAVTATTSFKDNGDWMLGTTIPAGPGSILASVNRHNDKTSANLDATQVGAGYIYNLSKRTSLYGVYAHISNKNGAFYTVGNATESGTGNAALNLGITHNF